MPFSASMFPRRRPAAHTTIALLVLSAVWLHAQAPTGTVTSSLTNILETGQALTMNVTVNSPAPAQIRWLRDGKVVTGATTATLAIPSITLAQAGSYRLEARNPSGTWTSPVIRVGVFENQTLQLTYQKGGPLPVLEAKVAGPLTVTWAWDLYFGGTREGSRIPLPSLPNGTHVIAAAASMNDTYIWMPVMTCQVQIKGFPMPPYAPQGATLKVGVPYGPADVSSGYVAKTPADRYIATGLPPGITLAEDGTLSGTPTRSGFYAATLYATDGIGRSRDVTMAFNVESTTFDLARRYSGIADPETYLGGETGGVMTVQVSPTGAYSAQVRSRSKVRSWTGQFERITFAEGGAFTRAEHTFRATPSDPGDKLTLTLDAGYAIDITSRSGPSLDLKADYRPLFEARHDIQGPHTLHIDGDIVMAAGFGTANITPSHSVIAAGTLPDGTGFTGSSPLRQNFQAPLLLQSADGRDDAVILLQFDPISPGNSTGTWTKRPSPGNRVFPLGFKSGLNMVSQRYYPPAAGKMISPQIADTDGICQIFVTVPERQPGQGEQFLPQMFFRMSRQHKGSFDTPNPFAFRLDAYAPTGFFTGSVLLPDASKGQASSIRAHFRGMLNSSTGMGPGQISVTATVEDPQTGRNVLRTLTGRIDVSPVQK